MSGKKHKQKHKDEGASKKDKKAQAEGAFIPEIAEEPGMPGHESELDRKPQWHPRTPDRAGWKARSPL
jgi:hypothetical protein